MSPWLVLLLAVPAVLLAVGRNEARRSRARAATVALEVTPLGVRRELADGREEHVDFAELEVVEVVRASIGPHKEAGGVVLLGAGAEHGCLVPLDRVGPSGLLERLSTLPEFDLKAFTEALDARPPRRTVVWTRPGHDDGVPDDAPAER